MHESPSSDLNQTFRRYLHPGEQLVWTGRPDPDVMFTPADLFLVPFSLIWGGFAIFWEVAAVTMVESAFFRLWGVPFVLFGLYFIVGRFIYKRWKKRRTAYALTTERALVAVGETALNDSPIRYVPVSIKRSRRGRHVTVTFGRGGSFWGGRYGNTGMEFFEWGSTAVAFYDVADPEGLLSALDRVRVQRSEE